MGLFSRERKGPAWKQGWTEQTLVSFSVTDAASTMLLKLFLLILPLLLILTAQLTWSRRSRRGWGSDDIVSNVAWSVVALVVVLLVMVSYHSQIQSIWTPNV